VALVDEVLDLEAAQGDAFARFADVGHGLGGGLFPFGWGRWLFGQFFEGALDDFFGRAAGVAGELVL